MILWAWELPYLHWQESLQFSLLVSFVCSLCGRLPSILYRLTSEMSRGEYEVVMWFGGLCDGWQEEMMNIDNHWSVKSGFFTDLLGLWGYFTHFTVLYGLYVYCMDCTVLVLHWTVHYITLYAFCTVFTVQQSLWHLWDVLKLLVKYDTSVSVTSHFIHIR